VELSFETTIDDSGVNVWVEAEVEVTNTGPVYADEQGSFGPDEFDVDILNVGVWLETGVEIYETLTDDVKRMVQNSIEERALMRH